MVKLYGIPNCDTIKKARQWLAENGVEYEFHDFRKGGLKKSKVEEWAKAAGFEDLMNKKSSTWRGLSDEEKKAAEKKSGALRLMAENPTLIKRPVVEKDKAYLTHGFDEAKWKELKHSKGKG